MTAKKAGKKTTASKAPVKPLIARARAGKVSSQKHKEKTAKIRAKGTSAPGRKPPPKEHRFTSENQPAPEKKGPKSLLWRQAFEGCISAEDVVEAVKQLKRKVKKGDLRAVQDILDRTQGKATQPLAGDPENPLIPSTLEIIEHGDSD